MQCTRRRHRLWFRGFSVVAIISFSVAAAACQSWHKQPAADPDNLAKEVTGRTVRFTTASGPVILAVRGVDFPYVTGVPQLGDGQVEFDVRTARRADVMIGSTVWQSIPTTEAFFTSQPVWGGTVRFTTDLGAVTMIVNTVRYPYVEGRPLESQGLVRLDLQSVKSVEFREGDVLKTVAVTAAVVGGSVLVALLMALVVRKVVLTRRERAAEKLAHPGLANETIEEIVEELEAQAEHDPVLRSKLHED